MFQSTHSLRSATSDKKEVRDHEGVSIHALLAECDGNTLADGTREKVFQSTHSLRSATCTWGTRKEEENVSIHALLAECDHFAFDIQPRLHGFNPRTPCGVRQVRRVPAHIRSMFQSTHSLRSATRDVRAIRAAVQVSIHALLAECDGLSPTLSAPLPCFNPRTPCGVRQPCRWAWPRWKPFQSTHSLRSATHVQPGR